MPSIDPNDRGFGRDAIDWGQHDRKGGLPPMLQARAAAFDPAENLRKPRRWFGSTSGRTDVRVGLVFLVATSEGIQLPECLRRDPPEEV